MIKLPLTEGGHIDYTLLAVDACVNEWLWTDCFKAIEAHTIEQCAKVALDGSLSLVVENEGVTRREVAEEIRALNTSVERTEENG